MNHELKPCPFCGSNEITFRAFSIGPDCLIVCECGAGIETVVPWGDLSKEEHDAECVEVLTDLWNRRWKNNETV